MSSWAVIEHRGSARALHANAPVDTGWRRLVRRCVPLDPALVLGSTQRDDVVDRAAARRAGVEVVRRRTGGGAVLVRPADVTWIDVVIPSGDPLWRDDVGLSTRWLGEAWASALAELGVGGTAVQSATMCHTKLSRLICFAGMGPGEVSAGDAKVVGIAQRRSRDGAWFQCMVVHRWDADGYAALLEPGLAAVSESWRDELRRVAVHPIEVPGDELVGALAASLRRVTA